MIPELDLAAKKEAAHYQEVSTRSRFLQQIFLGLGGAIVFGFVGSLTRNLLENVPKVLANEGLMSSSVLGLAGIAVVGIACLYMGAKYLSNNIMMEQDYSAKRIAMATHARAPQLAPAVEVEHTKPVNVGPITVSVAEEPSLVSASQKPDMVIRDVSTHQRLADAGVTTQRA